MISAICKCENGHKWETSVNENLKDEAIKKYFVGKTFNTASYPNEIMSTCCSCEVIRKKH